MASPTTWEKRTGGALGLFVLIRACCIVALTLLVRLFSPVSSSGGTVGAAISPRGAIPTLRVAGPTAPGRGRGPAESVPIVSAPDVGLLSVAPNSPPGIPPGPDVGAPPEGPNELPPASQPPRPSPPNPPPSPEPPPPEEPIVALADSRRRVGAHVVGDDRGFRIRRDLSRDRR